MNNENAYVQKPWGGYEILEMNHLHWLKKLYVNEGQSLSLQSHSGRSEIWVVLEGKIRAQKGENHYELGARDFIKIEKGEKHRIEALEKSVVLEAAFGTTLLEEDITRYEDKYGRV